MTSIKAAIAAFFSYLGIVDPRMAIARGSRYKMASSVRIENAYASHQAERYWSPHSPTS